jgi:hypothetical protein
LFAVTLGLISAASSSSSAPNNSRADFAYIPDATTAAKVGADFLEPLIGKAELQKGMPLIANLDGQVWTICTGSGGRVRLQDHEPSWCIRLDRKSGAVQKWFVIPG